MICTRILPRAREGALHMEVGWTMSGPLRSFSLVAAAAVMVFVTLPGAVHAADKVKASIAIKDHRFEPAELKVPAGKAIVLKVDNRDASAEEFECHVLDIEKIVAGNSTGIVRIRALKPGSYKCVGEFHEDTAKATIIAE